MSLVLTKAELRIIHDALEERAENAEVAYVQNPKSAEAEAAIAAKAQPARALLRRLENDGWFLSERLTTW